MAVSEDYDRADPAHLKRSPINWLYQRETREIIFQVLLAVGIAALFYMIVTNAISNLRARNIASGFGFLTNVAGFDISQTLISYTNTSTYFRAFEVGIVNTIVVAIVGIFFATILGFIVGMARLSKNWLIARLATVYVEVLRNCPLLLQMFLWYFAVLKQLPAPLERIDGQVRSTSLNLPLGGLLNSRGLFLPKPEALPGFEFVLYGLLAAAVASIGIHFWAKARQIATGQQFPVFLTSLALLVGVPVLLYFVLGQPLQFDYPVLGRFNLSGGMFVVPEILAVLLGLVFYTASYIAEIVRAGINGVPKGQKEAAAAIGLKPGQSMRLVVIPQAMRIIIPPLTSQFLNLTKNSSLAGAVGYPDLTQILGTVGNQTGQSIETIIMLMAVYLTISLITSAFMNWFNKRMALVER